MWDLSKLPIANLCTITGTDSAMYLTGGVCMLTVATMGVDMIEVGLEGVGWVSTLTLYLLLAIMVFLLLSGIFCFGSWGFPDSGVGAWLGWSWLV